LNLIAVALLLIVVHNSGEDLILVIGVVTFFASLLIMIIYPIFIEPCFTELKELEQGDLYDKIKKLSEEQNFRFKNVSVSEDSATTGHSNAYCTLMGDIVLSDLLLE